MLNDLTELLLTFLFLVAARISPRGSLFVTWNPALTRLSLRHHSDRCIKQRSKDIRCFVTSSIHKLVKKIVYK